MSQDQLEYELENCQKYYFDFENLKWLIKLLYKFRQDLKIEHNCKETPAKLNNIQISLTDLISTVEQIVKQIKAEQKNRLLTKDINIWLTDLKTVLSSYQEHVKLNEIGELISKVNQQFPAKRDFTNLILIFSFSTLLELKNIRNIIAGFSTADWQNGHGYCPICLNKPHYGLLRSKDGKKMLECWLCSMQWEFPRLKCPYCKNENQNQLGLFTFVRDDLCRVQFCENCFSYHKVFDLRKSGSVFLLEMHNFASLTHDLYAEKEGFQPGSGLSWVNEGDLINT
ncbi:formate dehydrogenase accessory protein FdhE [Natranaerobius thermophilus]|uniref:Formate dehydrogenase accessory protein n=1 Tax=Natranaerobius thermophilus (strain ATCC BAA-1301 / DSM 18059 / JW/NM-WN-LF) TaxID=457570 RepID=B2A1U8_NATTJ|nr:formate dehydrogenase accessory protein FdhE [Natranaerobius thermophilus]ACB86145.1 conserved hypothetical protein [Natranaerobius thermophilus JW/NM-WN-LF]